MKHTSTKEILHVGGKVKELITIHDNEGRVIHKSIRSIMLDFNLHDVIQVIVGATILAIPVGLTEEVWRLGTMLSWGRIIVFVILSLLFIALFTYYISYTDHLETHGGEFIKRLLGTYFISLIMAGIFLFMIDQFVIGSEIGITIKRMIIIAFPASLSAAVVDLIK